MEAFVWGAAAGAFQDALSGGIVGFNLITKPMVGISVALVREKLDFNNPNTQTVVTLVAAAAEGILLAVLLNAYQPSKDLLWSIPSIVIPGAVYNSLIIPFVLLAEGSLRTSLAQLKHRPARLTEQ
jgi:rod shape-determining protein MreD